MGGVIPGMKNSEVQSPSPQQIRSPAMKTLVRLLACIVPAPLTVIAGPVSPTPTTVDRPATTPDFCQTDPAGKFPAGGGYFCGPVAAANSLMFFARNGFPKLRPTANGDKESQIRMIHQLAAGDYMNTVGKRGTNPPRLMAGVEKFVGQAGYRVIRLEQHGWRDQTARFPAKSGIPTLAWIQRGVSAKGGTVWLNVGWYDQKPGSSDYQRVGGHWVTVVGCVPPQTHPATPPAILLHDPAPRTGTAPLTQRVSLATLAEGQLLVKTTSGKTRRHDAAGFLALKDGMKIKPGANTAIIDAAVLLEIQ